MRPSALLIIVVLLSSWSDTQAADSRAIARGDNSGFDYYDASWSYQGQSRSNHLGSFDFFDRVGHKVGWADATRPGRVTFHLANGLLFRTVVIDAAGGTLNLDATGTVKTIGVTNIRGGVDYYSPFTLALTNSSSSIDYVEFGEHPHENE